jgi:hypothetical protein
MDKDKVTTVIGAMMAAGTAATPVLNAVEGSLHRGDYLQLAVSVLMAVFGYFTNKQ